MNIVLLGPPGSGKGTQAELICKEFNLPHISTGDIFRQNISNDTELGKQVKSFISKGLLVPDSLTINIVKNRLNKEDCKNGFVLDGFPRVLTQAKALDEFSKIDKAIMIDLSDEEIINRLSKRRMCKECGNPTHLNWLVNGKCEKCGGEVYLRTDDAPETIRTRLKNQKLPQDVIDFYSNKGIFEKVNSKNTKEETFEEVKAILEKLNR